MMITSDRSPNMIDFRCLDGLRGIAALYVVICHCRANMMISGSQAIERLPLENWTLSTKIHYGLLQGTILGKEFVILFFILSGFSIAHSLRKNKSVVAFYKRRLIRLYLPMILALIWAFVVFKICMINGSFYNLAYSVFDTWEITALNLLYIPNGSMTPQFWSLTHEVIFYIIAPLILANITNTKIFIALTTLLFLIYFWISPLEPVGTNLIWHFFREYAIFFSIGIVLYKTIFVAKVFDLIRNKVLFISSILVLFPSMIICKFYFGLHNKWSLVLAALFSIVLIVNFLHYNIRPKWLVLLGKMSYTLYITHIASIFIMLFAFYKMNVINSTDIPDSWYIWIVGVVGCVILAIPLYLIGEYPTKKYLEKMR